MTNPGTKHYLNPKLTFAILGILLLAVGGFFVWQSYSFKSPFSLSTSSQIQLQQINQEPINLSIGLQSIHNKAYPSKFGENIEISINFTNQAEQDIVLSLYPEIYIFSAKIVKSTGQILTEWNSHKYINQGMMLEEKRPIHAPNKESFVQIPAGQTYTYSITLDRIIREWFKFKSLDLKPDIYLLTIQYDNNITGKEFGLNAWTGRITSNTINLDLRNLGTPASLNLKEQVVFWLNQLENSTDKETIHKAIQEIKQLAYKDLDEQNVKIAVPKLREFLKHSEGSVRLSAIGALGAIGDESAISDLQIISASGLHMFHDIQTEAGQAAGAIGAIKEKRKCLNKLAILDVEEQIALLLESIKADYSGEQEKEFKCHIPNELLVNLLIRTGDLSVPPMIKLLIEAMEIDTKSAQGISRPYYTTRIYYALPQALGNIGDLRAIPILKRVIEFQQEQGDPLRARLAQEALQSIRNSHQSLIIQDYKINQEVIINFKEIFILANTDFATLYQNKDLYFVRDKRVGRYDLRAEKISYLPYAPEIKDVLAITSNEDKIWIGTKNQILSYEPAIDKWSDYKFKFQGQDSNLVNEATEIISFDVNANFLVVGVNTKIFFEPGMPTEDWTPRSYLFGGGIFLVDLKSGEQLYLDKGTGFPSDNAWQIAIDYQNNIWSFVRSIDDKIIGLAFYHKEDKKWKLFNMKGQSFPQEYNEIYSIFPQADRVFITTDAGLYQISSSTHAVQSFDNLDYESSGGLYKIYAVFDHYLLSSSLNSQNLNLLTFSIGIVKILSLEDQKILWVTGIENDYYIGTEKAVLNIKLK